MLKTHLLKKIHLLGEKENSVDIQHCMRTAVILLFVIFKYKDLKITLHEDEFNELCYALTLPNLDKEHFLQFWTQFSLDVRIIQKYVPFFC